MSKTAVLNGENNPVIWLAYYQSDFDNKIIIGKVPYEMKEWSSLQ